MAWPDLTAALHRRDGPLYRQAAQQLRRAIGSGALKIGLSLPTEGDLARSFGVSLITIRAALRELEDDGLIRKRAAKTALVVGAVPFAERTREISTLAELAASTVDSTLRVTSYRLARSVEAARALGVDSRTMLPCLRGVLLRDDVPRTDLTIYLMPDIGRQLVRADFSGPVVFLLLEQKLGIQIGGAHVTVSARVADAGLAERLACAEGDPILVSRLEIQDVAGRPVQFTVARHRAETISVGYTLRRG